MSDLQALDPRILLESPASLFFAAASCDAIRTRLIATGHWADVAIHEWTPQTGMWRFTPEAGAVPGTRSALSAVGYMASVRRDSIFLLNDMQGPIQSQGLQMALLGALTLRTPARRRVVLPATPSPIPMDLAHISADLEQLLAVAATPMRVAARD